MKYGIAIGALLLAVTALYLQTGDPAPSPAGNAWAFLPTPATPIDNPGESVADYLSCLRAADVMMITGHRGGPVSGYPENALETFANTLAYGPMLLEVDVRMTKDGVFILMHDDILDRTTTGFGYVEDATLGEIKTLRLVDDEGTVTAFRVPTLAEALEWAKGRTILQLDVKRGAPIDEVSAFVSQADAQGYAAIIAYTAEDAIKAAAVDPRLTVSAQIMDMQTLDHLVAAGLPKDQLMAWTGLETEREALWRALNAQGISAAWGSLWYLDRQVAASGDAAPFVRLAEGALDVLSSDLHFMAFDSAETVQDTSQAVVGCNAGRQSRAP
ncbi:MAG: glycerophosphodiester phosphodiesterase family protein [Pseudomonadota bacterium]